jgi:hypothetical protein
VEPVALDGLVDIVPAVVRVELVEGVDWQVLKLHVGETSSLCAPQTHAGWRELAQLQQCTGQQSVAGIL